MSEQEIQLLSQCLDSLLHGPKLLLPAKVSASVWYHTVIPSSRNIPLRRESIRSQSNIHKPTAKRRRRRELPANQTAKPIAHICSLPGITTDRMKRTASLAVQGKVLGEGLTHQHVETQAGKRPHTVHIFLQSVAQSLVCDVK